MRGRDGRVTLSGRARHRCPLAMEFEPHARLEPYEPRAGTSVRGCGAQNSGASPGALHHAPHPAVCTELEEEDMEDEL